MPKLFNNKEKKRKPTLQELMQKFSDLQRTSKEYVIKNETSYKNKSRSFLYGMIFCVILFVPIFIFSIYEQITAIMQGLEVHNMSVGIVMNVIFVPLTLFMLKSLHTVGLLGYSSIFNIKFYEDSLEYKGLFNKKVINYSDVSEIKYLEVWLYGRGGAVEIDILELNLKDGKRIKLNCNTLSKKDAQELIDNLEVCTNLHKISAEKGILTFK